MLYNYKILNPLKYFLILALTTSSIAFSVGQTKSLKVYKHVDEKGIIHYSSKKPKGKKVSVLRIRCPECKWKNKVNWYTTPLNKKKFKNEIQIASKKWGLEPSLIRAVIHAESSFIETNVSSAGAQGLMQLMPATQKVYGVVNPFDPSQNINAGSEYLSHLLNTYKGNINLALAGYNAGETAVAKYNNSVPPYEETENYIKRINILRKRYKVN